LAFFLPEEVEEAAEVEEELERHCRFLLWAGLGC
jgi:hypothetical protein